jgi:hypothetical protein
MSVILQSSGGGSITLQEPATASNFTHTLPASTGTVLTTGSPQSGSVIQVVNYNGSGYTTTNSSTWSDVPNLSASITPKFATSTILIIATVIAGKATGSTAVGLRLVRNSTTISTFSDISGWTSSTVETTSPTSYTYLDSPATTSSTTYKVQFNSVQNTAVAIVGNYITALANTRHSITLMEIAA